MANLGRAMIQLFPPLDLNELAGFDRLYRHRKISLRAVERGRCCINRPWAIVPSIFARQRAVVLPSSFGCEHVRSQSLTPVHEALVASTGRRSINFSLATISFPSMLCSSTRYLFLVFMNTSTSNATSTNAPTATDGHCSRLFTLDELVHIVEDAAGGGQIHELAVIKDGTYGLDPVLHPSYGATTNDDSPSNKR